MLKMLVILLILSASAGCKTTPVVIEPVKDFDKEYLQYPENATEEEIYQHSIITGAEEIDYLLEYIEILINNIKAADGKRIKVIDLHGDKNDDSSKLDN